MNQTIQYENLAILEKKIKSDKIEGFVILKDNERIFEYFKNKKAKEKEFKLYSLTKSIISILVGILIDKGMVKDVHVPVYQFFPEILEKDDPRKKKVTIHHLLSMSSGLEWQDHGDGGGILGQAKNWVKFVLEHPVIHEPGEVFQYSCGSSHVLSAIISKSSGMTTAEFAEKYLFKPLKINHYLWHTDPQGIHGGGFSLSLSLEDLVKIGSLYLQNGKYESKQIISPRWIEESTKLQIQHTNERGVNGYGYQWWRMKANHIQYHFALGMFGQYIMIVPEMNLLAVVKSQLTVENQSLPIQIFNEFLVSETQNEN